jgi:drug/metabolite transporter (DMT)-like permease
MRFPARRFRTLVLMVVAMAACTFGDVFLAQAMQGLGQVRLQGLAQTLDLGLRIFSAPKVWLALGLFAVFFFLWMTVLSYEDLSFALPLTALTYLFNALLVGPFLNETVSPLRWAGTLVIGLGVALVTASGSHGPEHAHAHGHGRGGGTERGGPGREETPSQDSETGCHQGVRPAIDG